MPKQLINLIGVLVAVAVLALGIFLVAMPLATQALAVNTQAGQVATTNELYQAQVDSLTKAKQNKAETDASVAALRAGIPATPQLDGVFELVANAAQSSGATITTVTAGTPAAFVARTDTTSSKAQPTATSAPSPSPSPSPSTGTASSGTTSAAPSSGAVNATRQQVDFSITVSARDMAQATAFLDALRAGPRLLSNVTSTVAPGGSALQIQVNGLTYFDGGTAKAAK